MRFVEMVDLRLEFLDAPAVISAGEFEAARGCGRSAINLEKIPEGAKALKHHDEEDPHPFLAPDRINEHPNGERGTNPQEGRGEQVPEIRFGKGNGEHG